MQFLIKFSPGMLAAAAGLEKPTKPADKESARPADKKPARPADKKPARPADKDLRLLKTVAAVVEFSSACFLNLRPWHLCFGRSDGKQKPRIIK